MIDLLFYVPLFSYEINEWDRKKKALLSKVNRHGFDYYGMNDFRTDRHSKKNSYSLDFESIFKEELEQFKEDGKFNFLEVLDIWTLKYTKKYENHCPHNHRSTGYSGLIYLEYDKKVHEPTKFIGPWNDPVLDTTNLASIPNPREGVMYIWPSALVHYVDAMKTDKLRVATSWDMHVK